MCGVSAVLGQVEKVPFSFRFAAKFLNIIRTLFISSNLSGVCGRKETPPTLCRDESLGQVSFKVFTNDLLSRLHLRPQEVDAKPRGLAWSVGASTPEA